MLPFVVRKSIRIHYYIMKKQEITFDRFIRISATILLIIVVFYLVNYLSSVLLPFFIAWLFAYLLYPLVKFVQYKMHVKVRSLAIIITMLAVLGVMAGVVYAIIPSMIEQIDKLNNILNNWISQTTHSSDFGSYISQWVEKNQAGIEKFMKSKDFSELVKTTMPKLFSIVGQTASIIISVVASLITLLYTFFILQDYEFLTDNWIRIFPKKNRPFWSELMQDVERELNNYIRGQGLVSLCLGILFGIGLTIIDFPMAIALGIMMGLMNLVPYLHTLALVPMAFLAMLKAADTGQNFLIVFGLSLLVFLIVQVISDTVLTPKIMGKAMNLNPAILLLSLSIWGTLLGFIGLIVALPLTTLLIAYWKKYVTQEKQQEVLPQNEATTDQ
ncbi:hypothetical protein HMPREF9019_1951 [Hoylesella timonensis CRIS 5C-B1]|uniref:AI-2E family transporter n=2 Tax=Hoylesella timonensis TaxID=386414 RepID=D1VXW5_9BACT|nr:hypothetical protein HMPREF9019_1951 [Hoylesella timonensis CRIS 5C-B1]